MEGTYVPLSDVGIALGRLGFSISASGWYEEIGYFSDGININKSVDG